MYKKILLILFITSPFMFFLFIGYPIKYGKQTTHETALVTSRCFEIGNSQQFFSCFKNHKRINGPILVNHVLFEANDMQLGMGYVVFLFFLLQTPLLVILL